MMKRWSVIKPCLGVVWSMLVVGVAGAQSISPSIKTSATALTAQQKTEIEAYVTPLVTLMLNGTDAEIASSRERLKEQLGTGGSEPFNRGYSEVVCNKLREALKSENGLTRLNAMIVIASMRDASMVARIEEGLKDSSPAVRRWAAKAISAGGAVPGTFNAADDQRLLAALNEAMKTETADAALEKQIESLVALSSQQATLTMLQLLNKRVDLHVKDPNMAARSDATGLRLIARKILSARALGQGQADQAVPDTMVRELAKVAYRMHILSGKKLTERKLPAENTADWEQIVVDSYVALDWAAKELSPKGTFPPNTRPQMQQKRWPEVLLEAFNWEKVLRAAPFNMTAEELAV